MNAAYFVILAGMRTGSNLLEEQLASLPGIHVHGELFNPHFFGSPKSDSRFGVSLAQRDRAPLDTIAAMRNSNRGLHGFRFFHDHDPRVLSHVLADPACAKIVLTRRLMDSFISLEIARETGQWWLGDAKSARTAKVAFDADAFAEFQGETEAFYQRVERTLQQTGQTAFRLTYEDLSSEDIVDGAVKFLGVDGVPENQSIRARVQNPVPLEDRLTNPEAARAFLASEAEDLGALPSYEPARGPGVRYFRAGSKTPLLYMPIRGAGVDPVPAWLDALDDGEVLTGMTQRDLRRWRRQHPAHRSFTVVRHPLARAYDAFSRSILPTDQERYDDVRHALRHRFDVPLPPNWLCDGWTLERHRAAFLAFLNFLKPNLSGQTSVRVDSVWASQDRLLKAIASLVVPDHVFREVDIDRDLLRLADDVGRAASAHPRWLPDDTHFSLSDVVTPEIEKAAEAAYRRDYMEFGFGPWCDQAA